MAPKKGGAQKSRRKSYRTCPAGSKPCSEGYTCRFHRENTIEVYYEPIASPDLGLGKRQRKDRSSMSSTSLPPSKVVKSKTSNAEPMMVHEDGNDRELAVCWGIMNLLIALAASWSFCL